MLGALAWQATTVIKMFICLGGRSHGGYLVLAPGSPPCVLVCSFVCTSRPIRLHGTTSYRRDTFYRRESIMEPPTKDPSLNSCMWVCNGTQMKLSTICPRTYGTFSWELRRLNGELFDYGGLGNYQVNFLLGGWLRCSRLTNLAFVKSLCEPTEVTALLCF